MTMTDFEIACGEVLVDPALALENENIRKALSERDDSQVRELLQTEF